MKRWAIITVALYVTLLLLLTAPALWMGWLRLDFGQGTVKLHTDRSFAEAFDLMRFWSYWLWLAVLAAAQALLLLVPVKAAEARPVSRRHLLIPVVTGSFLLANIVISALATIVVAFGEDNMEKVLLAPAMAAGFLLENLPGAKPLLVRHGLMPGDEALFTMELIGLIGIAWMVWGWVFYSFAKADDATAITQRATRWLLRGSILELLVAVPCHIIIRQRNDCCAPLVSFWGIVTGVSVMLIAFGPGVFFLYVRRFREKQARLKPPVIPENAAN